MVVSPDILRDLIATCRDSEEGFGKAAKGVTAIHFDPPSDAGLAGQCITVHRVRKVHFTSSSLSALKF
jgi:hypothetical protein